MIEDLLRETFDRHEALTPAADEVRRRIEVITQRRRRRGYAMRGAAVVLAVIGLLTAVAAKPGAVPGRGPLGSAAALLPTRPSGPLTVLLVGLDKRPDGSGSADTVMVAHLPAGGGPAYLISVPRAVGEARGFPEWVAELGRAGVPVDIGAVVDFAGVVAVTDAVGGVDMCVDRRVVSDHWGVDTQGRFRSPREGGRPMVYEPGCRRFTGAEALDYLRQRRSLPEGDAGRQRHVRIFVEALLDRLAGADPERVVAVLVAAGNGITVDLRGRNLLDLVRATRGMTSADVVSIGPRGVDGWPDLDRLWAALRAGTLPEWVAANPDHVD